MIARVTAGRRFVVLLFTMLLVIAVVAQVWFGSLLMFDTPSGPLGSFNEPQKGTTTQPSTLPTTRTVALAPAK